ncbi:DUF2846 domain-containing protein [Pedobacter sp. MC2016-05]|uniref:DUF2846 domain-containing protein n=1 Tax=Pedobacter sp. MC2016-05 TaxID=2994474 RepID=UPI00224770C1|nr:DUF2846 domain-containing protein [Pedobacter sp. MC2016-05]MCX2477020.1 DUF2846 domain-containing protein [Pedobacter sp. MC2016-05]
MKNFRIIASILFMLCIAGTTLAQDKTGKIYVIRRTGINGSAVNFRLYLDGELICKMKNKSYSMHDITAGEHTISVVAGGLPDNRNKIPVKFTVISGKSNYFMINSGNELSCMEITQSAAEPMIARSVQVTDCLGAK